MSKTINLLQYRGNGSSYYTGRPQGEDVRIKLELDKLDNSDEVVIFVIPYGTTSINPSFYLGLLFESFKKLGKEKFLEKYKIEFEEEDEVIRGVLNRNIEDALRSATISVNNKGGFKRFL